MQTAKKTASGPILISGTGRAGTTVMVQILTWLGLDTGFTLEQALTEIDSVSRGGLERRLFESDLPTFVKSPYGASEVESFLASGSLLRLAIVPIRNLTEAAESRRQVSKKAEQRGQDPFSAAGGLYGTGALEDQEAALAMNFYQLLETLVKHDVPIVFVSFPRFLLEPEYFYKKLESVFREYEISLESVKKAFKGLVKPELMGRSLEADPTLPDARVVSNTSATLDLGCGTTPRNPFKAHQVFGIDIRESASGNIVAADLAVEPIPFANETFDFLTAYDFIEHVPRILYLPKRRFSFVELMNEIYRVLKPGGVFLSHTPAFPAAAAWRDPTHVNIITNETFPLYFDDTNRYAAMYGFNGYFKIVKQVRDPNKIHLVTVMRKVSPPL
jgi:SAM-dependent methyltransferase